MARPPRVPQVDPSTFDDEPDATATPARRLVVEADGGFRGNPGPAAYGALVRDPDTDDVLNSKGRALGMATNNVAEYPGLVAGLEMARDLDPAATVDLRMDSRLVLGQRAGRWTVKHPTLAVRAQELPPAEATWTWVPRERNKAADALVGAALDGSPRTRR